LNHYLDFIADPREAAFDDPSNLSALAEEAFRQAVVDLRNRTAGFARFGDFDDGFAYAKPRAGIERVEVYVFGEEVRAQASGRDFKAFVLYFAQRFNGEEADLAVGIASGVAVAAQSMIGDEFSGFDGSFPLALPRADVNPNQFSNQSVHSTSSAFQRSL
jgi:hypothetical protein